MTAVTALAADEPDMPRNVRTQFLNRAESDLSVFSPTSRANADTLLSQWRYRDGLTPSMRTELLDRFYPEPTLIPGVHFLPVEHYEAGSRHDVHGATAYCACGDSFRGRTSAEASSALTAHATRQVAA